MEAVVVADAAKEDPVPYCIPCKGNICYCEDKRQVTYFTDDADYYEQLERDSNMHPEDDDEDQVYWSADEDSATLTLSLPVSANNRTDCATQSTGPSN